MSFGYVSRRRVLRCAASSYFHQSLALRRFYANEIPVCCRCYNASMTKDQISNVTGVVAIDPAYVELTGFAATFREMRLPDEDAMLFRLPVIEFDYQGGFVRLKLYRKEHSPVETWIPAHVVLCFLKVWTPQMAQQMGFKV